MPAERPPPARRIALAATLGLFAAIVISCGYQDYGYPVAGNYALARSSADRIIIYYTGPPQSLEKGIKEKVVALNWDERYVLAKRQEVDARGRPVSGAFDWWILDTRDHVRHGPLTEGEFGELRTRLGIDPGLELKKPIEFVPDSKDYWAR